MRRQNGTFIIIRYYYISALPRFAVIILLYYIVHLYNIVSACRKNEQKRTDSHCSTMIERATDC